MCDERSAPTKETIKKRGAILNIAAGRFAPLLLEEFKPYHLINVDWMYSHGIDNMRTIEEWFSSWETTEARCDTVYCKIDIWEFLENFSRRFNHIVIYRFLEHIPRAKMDYFIYLLSGVLKVGGYIDCIVPNYELLAGMILNEPMVDKKDWEAHDILVTTELLNEPPDSHASIWTPDRAEYYFEKEKRFKVEGIEPKFRFDGRDIYMRFFAKRVERSE